MATRPRTPTTFTGVAVAIVLLAGCGSSSSHANATAASPAVSTSVASGPAASSPSGVLVTTIPGASDTRDTSASSSGSIASGAACDLLTPADITAATGNTAVSAVEDDTNAAAGEQSCLWTIGGTGTAASGGANATLVVNLETGPNAVTGFNGVKTATGIQIAAVPGVGDDAVLTSGANLFVKSGDKVIELSYQGIPTEVVQTFLTALAQSALPRL
ncbi:MAG: hypothetical protein ACXV8V_00425 [Ilumatobacteraceae bacterium]